jgi:hypothetical protein
MMTEGESSRLAAFMRWPDEQAPARVFLTGISANVAGASVKRAGHELAGTHTA